MNLAAIALKSDGGLSGFSTGLTGLNARNGAAFIGPDLIILAGRPGMGKSSAGDRHGLSLGGNNAPARPRTGGVFLRSRCRPNSWARILSERARIDSNGIRQGRFHAEEFDGLVEVSDALSVAPFYIDDTPSLSVSQVASRARRMKRTGGLGLIVVDYLQLLMPQLGVRSENRVQEISNISRSLKAIAKELDVPVLASQLSPVRLSSSARPAPNLSDLRESGSIEQDADVVLFDLSRGILPGQEGSGRVVARPRSSSTW